MYLIYEDIIMSNDRQLNLTIFTHLLEEKYLEKEKKKTPKDYKTRIDKLITKCIKEITSSNYTYKAHYKNSKDVIVELAISKHALDRFIKRLYKVYNGNISDLSNVKLEQLMCLMINSGVRENLNKCKLLAYRKRKHFLNNGLTYTVYLKYGCFRFVISERKVITVELRGFYHNDN